LHIFLLFQHEHVHHVQISLYIVSTRQLFSRYSLAQGGDSANW
jgi:hypothetical protein